MSALDNLKQAISRAAILRTEEVRITATDARAILKYLEAESARWTPPVIAPNTKDQDHQGKPSS
jgi:hypothetical protein